MRASAALQSNRVAPKCSQMVLRKDKLETSTGNSPLTPTLILSITTTYLTATSRMGPVAPKRSTQKPPKTTILSRPQVLGTQARKYP